MNRYRYSVSLRIRHPSADPQRFFKRLGISPIRAWKSGDLRKTPTGRPLKGRYGETYWTSGMLARGAWPKRSLAAALQDLSIQLARHKPFFKRIRSEKGRVELFVGWYFSGNSGDVIHVELMKELQSLGIDLSLDIYPPDQPQRGI